MVLVEIVICFNFEVILQNSNKDNLNLTQSGMEVRMMGASKEQRISFPH